MSKNNCKRYGLISVAIFLIVILINSCSNSVSKKYKTKHGIYALLSKSDTLHYLQIKTDSTLNQWELPYPVFQFQVGDVDDNGIEDLLVGVIKATRFDSVKSNRLFIFQNYKGYVRPLWLGSRLGQPLIDFAFVQAEDGARIRSIEYEKSGLYQVVEYKWRSFGLDFTRYIRQEIDLKEAKKNLQTKEK